MSQENPNLDCYSSESDNSEDEDLQEQDLHFYPICCTDVSDVSASHATLADAVAYDLQTNKFDFLQHLPSASDDQFFEKAIVCVNRARTFVSSTNNQCDEVSVTDIVQGEKLGITLSNYLNESNKDKDIEEEDEEFFRPFLTDDAFILCMDDLQDLIEQKENKSVAKMSTDSKDCDKATSSTNEELKMRITALEDQLACAKSCITSLAVDESFSSTTTPAAKDNDTYYFDSYSHTSIHEIMLQDNVRTKAYKDAILLNSTALFKDKVVIDLGCGTGILSLFAAKAGAKKVIAIDASDIYMEATDIARLNGYDDVITVVHGKVEDLIAQKKLPLGENEKVNIIISEWMGYALFFETMLPSVLTLRDSYMDKLDGMGTMYPNKCSIFLEAALDKRLDYWDDVYGMDMHPMKNRMAKELKNSAAVETVSQEKVATERVLLKGWNLNECSEKELDFVVPFELKMQEGEDDSVRLDKLVISFDIAFDLPEITPVFFSTGCQSESTHWKQTALWIDPTNGSPFLKKGEVMKGTFQMGRNPSNHRDMDFLVVWEIGCFERGDVSIFRQRCGGAIVQSLKA